MANVSSDALRVWMINGLAQARAALQRLVLPMDEVRRLGALGGAEINEAKKILATEATVVVHGDRKSVV